MIIIVDVDHTGLYYFLENIQYQVSILYYSFDLTTSVRTIALSICVYPANPDPTNV